MYQSALIFRNLVSSVVAVTRSLFRLGMYCLVMRVATMPAIIKTPVTISRRGEKPR